MAMLQVLVGGGGAYIIGSGLMRIMRVTKGGKVTIQISGGNAHKASHFTFYAKYRDKK